LPHSPKKSETACPLGMTGRIPFDELIEDLTSITTLEPDVMNADSVTTSSSPTTIKPSDHFIAMPLLRTPLTESS
jgi:hypothetical protein